jgi:hypothetical protein
MSSGTFKLDPDGQGVFEGTVSLENNGLLHGTLPFDKKVKQGRQDYHQTERRWQEI